MSLACSGDDLLETGVGDFGDAFDGGVVGSGGEGVVEEIALSEPTENPFSPAQPRPPGLQSPVWAAMALSCRCCIVLQKPILAIMAIYS